MSRFPFVILCYSVGESLANYTTKRKVKFQVEQHLGVLGECLYFPWITEASSGLHVPFRFMIKHLLLKLRGVPLGSAHLSHVLMELRANALPIRPCAIFSPTRLCINVVRFVRIHIRRTQGCLKLEMVGAWRPCVRREDSGYIPGSLAVQPCGASLWKVAHGLGLCGMISKGKVGNTQALVEVPRHAGMGGRMDGYPN